jgi:hypothetical protein
VKKTCILFMIAILVLVILTGFCCLPENNNPIKKKEPVKVVENVTVFPSDYSSFAILYTDTSKIVRMRWGTRSDDPAPCQTSTYASIIMDCPPNRKNYAEIFVDGNGWVGMIIHMHNLDEIRMGPGSSPSSND